MMKKMARKNQKAPWEEEEEIIWVSRTELKNDMLALQKLGEELVELKPSALARFPLPEDWPRRLKMRNVLKTKLVAANCNTLAN